MERIRWDKVIRWSMIALLVGALIWLAVYSVNFRVFGLGIVLILLWDLILGWLIVSGHTITLLRRWHRWLGAICITVALLGLPVLFPSQGLSVRGISFDEVTLGGLVGQYIIGSSGFAGFSTVWRILVFVVAGLVLIFPGATRNLLLNVFSAIGNLVKRKNKRWILDRNVVYTTQIQQPVRISEEGVKKKEPNKHITESVIDDKVAQEKTTVSREEINPVELLIKSPEVRADKSVQENNERRAQIIEQALASYGVEARVIQVNPGPLVTQFGVEPGWDRKFKKMVERDFDGKVRRDRNGNPIEYYEEVSKTRVKVDRITSLANDLAMAMAVSSLRIEAPVPGKSVIGIEVPNDVKAIVSLRNSIDSVNFDKMHEKSKLALALGQGAGAEVVVGDLAQMPHLLIAGSTGSGKTVCLSSIITCLLVNATPDEVRLLLIDPKRVELVAFNNVPHLIAPVVVDLEAAIGALRRVTWEMDNRYRKFAAASVNNIVSYNKKVNADQQLPYLVIVIDELADLMAASADMVEPAICRIAQLSRATGIHMVIATQRPSVDVITGLIKANFPSRISFSVPSQIDSRTILDIGGAEKLLGGGDMLYLPIGAEKPKRLRGAFVSDQEVQRLVQFWKQHRGASLDQVAKEFASLEADEEEQGDPLLEEARRLAIEHNRVSTSLLQRRLHVGYPRAARIMDILEEEGIISSGEPGKPRHLLGSDYENN